MYVLLVFRGMNIQSDTIAPKVTQGCIHHCGKKIERSKHSARREVFIWIIGTDIFCLRTMSFFCAFEAPFVVLRVQLHAVSEVAQRKEG